MTHYLVDKHGTLLDVFDDEAAAVQAMDDIIGDIPEAAKDIAVVCVDEYGGCVPGVPIITGVDRLIELYRDTRANLRRQRFAKPS